MASHFLYGQRPAITKQDLLTTINQFTEGKYWTASNEDNSFDKLDTIIFYSNLNFQQEKIGCNYKNWRFIDEKTLRQNESMICAEPTEETIYPDSKGLFIVKLEERNNHLFIATIQKGRIVNYFQVIGLKEVEIGKFIGKSIKLTLIRIKQENQRLTSPKKY